jgi:hypothetical protein
MLRCRVQRSAGRTLSALVQNGPKNGCLAGTAWHFSFFLLLHTNVHIHFFRRAFPGASSPPRCHSPAQRWLCPRIMSTSKYTFAFSNLCGVSYKGGGNLLFSRDDALLVPVGNRVSVFDCRAHASYTLDCQARADVDRIALSPDGRLLLAVDTGALRDRWRQRVWRCADKRGKQTPAPARPPPASPTFPLAAARPRRRARRGDQLCAARDCAPVRV